MSSRLVLLLEGDGVSSRLVLPLLLERDGVSSKLVLLLL